MGMVYSKIKSSSVLLSFIIFLCAFALFASGMLLSPTTASAATGMWVTETVDGPGIVGWDSSVAVDSKGWVHISYYDASNGDLRHAVNAYGVWVIDSVMDGAQGDVGWYSSIAIDSSDKVHIGYYDFDREYLMHATNVTGTWVPEIVDNAGGRGEHLSLALDQSDKVHISYYDRGTGDLWYATNSGPPPPPGSTWTKQLVDDTGDIGWYTSVAVDSGGKVHISYYDADNMKLKYATTNASGGWDTETVDSGGDIGWDTSLAVDGSGRVHISYYDATTDPPKKDLRYATGNAGAWETVTVDSAGDVGEYSSLFADPSGIVHIGYHDYTNGTLKYAVSNSSNVTDGWVVDTVDSSSGDVGSYASLTVDSTGDIHISYYDGVSGDLRYAVSRALINLKKGFNIISAPTKSQIIPDAVELLGFIDPAGDGVSKVLRYNRVTLNVEQAYRSNGDIVGNFSMTAGDGLIVYASRDIAIDLLQDVCPELSLMSGTNWIGTPCQPVHQTAFSMLQAIGSDNAVSIQRFNTDTGSFETAAYKNGLIVGNNFPIEGGNGYLIHMNTSLSGFRP